MYIYMSGGRKYLLREAKPGGFQTGGSPIFFGKGPDWHRGPFRDCSSLVVLNGREIGKGQIGKIPGESPSKSGKSQKIGKVPKWTKQGRTSPDRENPPPFENPPRFAALEFIKIHWGEPKQPMKLQQPRNYDFGMFQFNLSGSQGGNSREMTTSPPGHYWEVTVALTTAAKLQQVRANSREMTSQKLNEEHEILRHFMAVVVSSAFWNYLNSCQSRFSGVYLVFEVLQDTDWHSNKGNPGVFWIAALPCPVSGPVRDTPPYRAIPFRASIARGVSHPFALFS